MDERLASRLCFRILTTAISTSIEDQDQIVDKPMEGGGAHAEDEEVEAGIVDDE